MMHSFFDIDDYAEFEQEQFKAEQAARTELERRLPGVTIYRLGGELPFVIDAAYGEWAFRLGSRHNKTWVLVSRRTNPDVALFEAGLDRSIRAQESVEVLIDLLGRLGRARFAFKFQGKKVLSMMDDDTEELTFVSRDEAHTLYIAAQTPLQALEQFDSGEYHRQRYGGLSNAQVWRAQRLTQLQREPLNRDERVVPDTPPVFPFID